MNAKIIIPLIAIGLAINALAEEKPAATPPAKASKRTPHSPQFKWGKFSAKITKVYTIRHQDITSYAYIIQWDDSEAIVQSSGIFLPQKAGETIEGKFRHRINPPHIGDTSFIHEGILIEGMSDENYKITQKSKTDIIETKITKVYSAGTVNGNALSYIVRWNGNDLPVIPLKDTSPKQIGDTINVMVTICHSPKCFQNISAQEFTQGTTWKLKSSI